jgi:hypothetical protein
MATTVSLSLSRVTPRRASGLRGGARRQRRAAGPNPARVVAKAAAATAEGGEGGGSDGDSDVEVVRYGLGRGSTAFYPRASQPPPSTSAPPTLLPRRDTNPSTTYEDGALDKLAIALFNWKLEGALNESTRSRSGSNDVASSSSAASASSPPLPAGGFPRLVALADRIAVTSASPTVQRQVVLTTLLGLIPGPVRTLFKMLIKPAPWVDRMNAVITVVGGLYKFNPVDP